MPYVGRDLQRGNYLKLDDITSSFDGSTTTFNLQSGGSAFYPGSAFSIFVVLSGLAQEPESAYTINKNTITFASAPSSVDDCFITALGVALGVGVPGHGTVNGSQLAKPFNYDGGLLYLDSANDKIGVANTTPVVELDVNGRLDADYITGIAATFSGNVTIGGTLTYQDVSNIDSVGIITAQAGIHLGIGATSGKFLASTGITTFSSSVGIADSIFHVGNNDTSIRFPADDTFAVETAGSERLRIKSNGDVGIGLDSPTARLHVNGTTNGLQARFGGTGTGLGIECGQKTNANALVKLIAQDSTHGTFAFRTAGDERLRITSAGNIGIGTNNPDELLHISSAGITTARFRLTDRRTSLSVGTQYGVIQFEQRDSNTPGVSVEVAAVMQDTSNGNTALQFKTGTPNTIDERVRISGHGHLGVGDNNPDTRLSVTAASGTDVVGKFTSTDAKAWIQFRDNSTTDTGVMIGAEGDDMMLRAGSNERLRIDSSGNVKLTTSAYQTLAIKRFGYSASYQSIMVGNPNSNVGVVALNVDVSGISGSNFHAKDQVVTGYRGFLTPNAAGNNFIGVFTRDASADKIYFGPSISSGVPNGPITATTSSVGINEASPDAPLHITGGLPHIRLENSGTSASADDVLGQIDFKHNDSDDAGVTAAIKCIAEDNAGNSYLTVHNGDGGNADERLRINSNGRVNIANSNLTGSHLDYTRLNVYGQTSHGGTNKNLNLLNVYNYGSGGVGDITGIGLGAGASPGGYTKASIGFIRTGTYGRGDLIFCINDQGNGNQVVEANERLRITSGGNVDINGTPPWSVSSGNYRNLSISGSDASSSGFLWLGNGVATTNADFDLGRVNFCNGATIVARVIGSCQTSANDDGRLTFHTKETGQTEAERLRITSTGKVLVGDGSSITPVKQFDVRGTGYQGILVGSTNNQGAQLIIDGIGGGDASGGNYSGFDVGTDGHLKIKNYDADKNIVLGTGSQTGANDTLTIDSDQMVTIATRNSSSGGDLGLKFGSFGIRSQDVGGYNYWHIDRNYGGWQSNMISLKADGKVGINQAVPSYQLHVNGSFAATTKSFVIDHPTKENHSLRYACLEGPENSVYVRGRSSDPVIELPEYWVGLVHDDSITVNVTPIGNKKVWVESINNNSVTIGSDDSTEYFYTVFAERKDVEKLEVEVEK